MASRRVALFVVSRSIVVLPCVLACGGGSAQTGSGSTGQGAASGLGGQVTGTAGTDVLAGTGGSSGGRSGAGGGSGDAVGGNGIGGSSEIGNGGAGGRSAGGYGGLGSGGAAGESAGAAGALAGGVAGASGCSGLSQTRSSRAGASSGFSGSYESNYYPLYSHACSVLADCSSACVTAGGTQASCAASECISSTPNYCLPPTYWFGLDQLLVEGNTTDSSAWIIMVSNPYRDTLSATNFQFEIPSGAHIQGVEFAFNESADSSDLIGDFSVRALSNGAATGLDRGHTAPWSTTFHYENYGGPSDTWGATWTPAAVNAANFGVALTPVYLSTAGNARAYVDFVRATVYYDACN